MATTEELYALLPQAYKSGDMEAVARIKAALPAAMKAERQAGLREQAQKDPWYTQAAAGFSEGANNVLRRAVSWLDPREEMRAKANEQIREAKELYAPATDTGWGRGGRFAGEMAVTMPLAAGVGGAARAGLAASGVKSVLPRIASLIAGGAEGAVPSAMLADEGERGTAAAFGGALNVALPMVVGGGAKLLTGAWRPKPGSAAETLIREGVDITPGMSKPSGIWNQMEALGSSYPLISPRARGASNAAIEQARIAAGMKGYHPIMGPKPTGTATEVIDKIGTGLEGGYSTLLGGKTMTAGIPLRPGQGENIIRTIRRATNINDLAQRGVNVDPKELKNAADFLERMTEVVGTKNYKALIREAARKTPSTGPLPQVDATKMQFIRSQAYKEARAARAAGKSGLAEVYDDVADKITASIEAQLPAEAKVLGEVDRAYANWVKTAKANSTARARLAAGGGEGGFTMQDLEQAGLEGLSKTQRGRGYGNAVTDLAELAAPAFKNREPTTGHRVLMNFMLGALGGGAGAALGRDAKSGTTGTVAAISLPVVAGLMAGSPTARRAALGQLGFQQSLHNLGQSGTGKAIVDALRTAKAPVLARIIQKPEEKE